MMCDAICSEEKKEKSVAVEMIFDLLRNFTWKITSVDGAELQQKLALQLFKFLSTCTTLEDVASKLISIWVSLDKKEMEEEKTDWEALLVAMTEKKSPEAKWMKIEKPRELV